MQKNKQKAAAPVSSSLPFISLKEEAKPRVIAFFKKAIPIGKRTEADLIELGIMAHESGSHMLLQLFAILPPLDELRKAKMKRLEQ